PPITITVRQGVVTALSPSTIPPGGWSVLTTTVKPGSAGEVVHLQRKTASGWTTVDSKSVTSKGRQSFRFQPGSIGSLTFRIRGSKTATLDPGTGRAVTLTVTKKGRGNHADHAYLATYHGHPMSWNPCRVIHYRVNLANAPHYAVRDVTEAL